MFIESRLLTVYLGIIFLTPFDTWLEDQYQQYMTLNTGEERVLKDCVCD